jgi:hypothetical protein
MKINKGVQAMIRGRKLEDPDFKISSKKILKVGNLEIQYDLNFWFKVRKIQSGEYQ